MSKWKLFSKVRHGLWNNQWHPSVLQYKCLPHIRQLCVQSNLYQIPLLILGGGVGKNNKKKTNKKQQPNPKIFPLFKRISCLPYCYTLCCGRPIYRPKKGKSTTGGRKTKLGKNRRKCGCHLAKQSRTNWAQKSPSLSELLGANAARPCSAPQALPGLCAAMDGTPPGST